VVVVWVGSTGPFISFPASFVEAIFEKSRLFAVNLLKAGFYLDALEKMSS